MTSNVLGAVSSNLVEIGWTFEENNYVNRRVSGHGLVHYAFFGSVYGRTH